MLLCLYHFKGHLLVKQYSCYNYRMKTSDNINIPVKMLFKCMTQKRVVINLPLNGHIGKLHICSCVYTVTVPVSVNKPSKLCKGLYRSKVSIVALARINRRCCFSVQMSKDGLRLCVCAKEF